MSTYRTGHASIAVLTDEGWLGTPLSAAETVAGVATPGTGVQAASVDRRGQEGAISDPLVDCRRIRQPYRWSPGDNVLDVPAAQPWTRSGR